MVFAEIMKAMHVRQQDLKDFWARVREAAPHLPEETPEAWAFGATPEHADGLLALVLSGTKTATASSLWDYEAQGDPIPAVGWLSIILDGEGKPRSVIETTAVATIAFDQVSEKHAHAEGEGDRTLTAWREIHERYWRNHSENPHGFEPDMPVICEEFRVIYPTRTA